MNGRARASIILPLAALSILLGLTLATQMVAQTYGYPREFGAGAFDLGTVRVYAPWSFVGWYMRFQPSYPKPFDLAGLAALTVAMAPVMLAALLTRRSQREPKVLAGTPGPASMTCGGPNSLARADNPVENSHLVIRRRERKQQKFKSQGSAQRFLASHSAVYNTFNLQPHLISRPTLQILRAPGGPGMGSREVAA